MSPSRQDEASPRKLPRDSVDDRRVLRELHRQTLAADCDSKGFRGVLRWDGSGRLESQYQLITDHRIRGRVDEFPSENSAFLRSCIRRQLKFLWSDTLPSSFSSNSRFFEATNSRIERHLQIPSSESHKEGRNAQMTSSCALWPGKVSVG